MGGGVQLHYRLWIIVIIIISIALLCIIYIQTTVEIERDGPVDKVTVIYEYVIV